MWMKLFIKSNGFYPPTGERSEKGTRYYTESMFCREIILAQSLGVYGGQVQSLGNYWCPPSTETLRENQIPLTVFFDSAEKATLRNRSFPPASKIIYTEIFSDFKFMQNVQGSWGSFAMWTNGLLDASLGWNTQAATLHIPSAHTASYLYLSDNIKADFGPFDFCFHGWRFVIWVDWATPPGSRKGHFFWGVEMHQQENQLLTQFPGESGEFKSLLHPNDGEAPWCRAVWILHC